jgi:hypothetical protein
VSVDAVAVNVTTAVPLQAVSTESALAASSAITQRRDAGRKAAIKQALNEFMADRGPWNRAGIVQRFGAHEKRSAGKDL